MTCMAQTSTPRPRGARGGGMGALMQRPRRQSSLVHTFVGHVSPLSLAHRLLARSYAKDMGGKLLKSIETIERHLLIGYQVFIRYQG